MAESDSRAGGSVKRTCRGQGVAARVGPPAPDRAGGPGGGRTGGAGPSPGAVQRRAPGAPTISSRARSSVRSPVGCVGVRRRRRSGRWKPDSSRGASVGAPGASSGRGLVRASSGRGRRGPTRADAGRPGRLLRFGRWAAIHSGRVEGSASGAGRRARHAARRHQGRLARPGAPASPGPDRRRSRRRGSRHSPDGRDQRCLRCPHARRDAGPGPARPRLQDGRRTHDRTAATAQPAVRHRPQDPSGHGAGRHERHLPSAEPDDNTTRGPPPTQRAGAAPQRPQRGRSCGPRSPRDRWSEIAGPTTRSPSRRRSSEALETEITFGKFHGHTLGEIAAFEPSYIDWLAGTMVRQPEVAMAARVIVVELDRLGIRRLHRPARPGWQSNPYR